MIHAYQEMYLNKAQDVLGDAFDYAVNTQGYTGKEFVQMFTMSTAGKKMENGEPAYIAGKSGIEIALEVTGKDGSTDITIEDCNMFGRSREYWIGWAVCYYQWLSGRKYSEIFDALHYENLEKMYNTLHEADISKFADIADSYIKSYYPETRLKKIRMTYGFSQSELAKNSSVSLRSIQMYEQRNKDINKASAETIYRISKTLGCAMEDLLEK